MFKFTGINRMMLWLPCLFFKMPIYTYKLWVSLNENEKKFNKMQILQTSDNVCIYFNYYVNNIYI